MKISLVSEAYKILIKASGIKKLNEDKKMFKTSLELVKYVNNRPHTLPSFVKRKVSCTHFKIEGMDCYTLKGSDQPTDRHIFYLHGGSYIMDMNMKHWRFCTKLAKELNCTVTIPLYPLAPNFTYALAFDKVLSSYKKIMNEESSKNLILMGDSAGGGFALALAELLQEKKLPQPQKIILISPWLDLTCSNPKIEEVKDLDPMLGVLGLIESGKTWAGNKDRNHYLLSPINGKLIGLAPITLIVGTHDILYPDAKHFNDLMVEANLPISYYEYPEMFHVFPLSSGPESKDAFTKIERAIYS